RVAVPTADQDPTFSLDHPNIDRLWNLWLAQGGGRTDPPSDNTWKSRHFTFFDENANQVKLNSCQVMRAAEQLNYTYEGEPSQVNLYCVKLTFNPWLYSIYVLFHWPIPPFLLTPKPTLVSLDIRKIRERLPALAESKTDTLFLK